MNYSNIIKKISIQKHPLFKDKKEFWDKIIEKREDETDDRLVINDKKDDEISSEDKTYDDYITIIYPPIVDWYMLYQRPQQLCTAFSKIEKVRSIFISNETFKKLPEPITNIKEDLYVISSGIDYEHIIKGKKVLWFSYPHHYTYSKKHDFDLIVFDSIDNPVDEFIFWNKDITNAINCADIISCTADILYEHHKSAGKPIFLCPNGTDYKQFEKAQFILPKPDDFPEFEDDEIVIGFYGALASWVDYKLIKEIAKKYKVILIGKNKYYNKSIYNENIFVLEHKPYEQLPFYLSHFDFTLIPFKLTEMIKGCDPVKFYEYISAGKPVLSTEIEELTKKFSDITTFINTENCLEKIEEALKKETIKKKAKRIEIAKQNSWDVRVEIAYEMIKKHIK